MKSYVTINNKKVAVSEITSIEKPFPFSKNFHDLSIGEMECDVTGIQRNIHAFESMKQDDYTRKEIKGLRQKKNELINEINHRREFAEKHNLRRLEN